MSHPQTNPEAAYLSRPFRCLFLPVSLVHEVRAELLAGGVSLLPSEQHASRPDVIMLAAGSDLDLVAGILSNYEGRTD